jgi:hypothetical protein
MHVVAFLRLDTSFLLARADERFHHSSMLLSGNNFRENIFCSIDVFKNLQGILRVVMMHLQTLLTGRLSPKRNGTPTACRILFLSRMCAV